MRMLSVWNTRLEDLFIMLLLLGLSDVIVCIWSERACMHGGNLCGSASTACCVCVQLVLVTGQY